MTTYAIVFAFPEGTVYAGDFKGGLGFAPTIASALLFETFEAATNTLANGYGAESVSYGKVVAVGPPASSPLRSRLQSAARIDAILAEREQSVEMLRLKA